MFQIGNESAVELLHIFIVTHQHKHNIYIYIYTYTYIYAGSLCVGGAKAINWFNEWTVLLIVWQVGSHVFHCGLFVFPCCLSGDGVAQSAIEREDQCRVTSPEKNTSPGNGLWMEGFCDAKCLYLSKARHNVSIYCSRVGPKWVQLVSTGPSGAQVCQVSGRSGR